VELGLGNAATAAAQHLWMTDAIGAMTLAVMTRATLGHTGRALTANRATLAIYHCPFAAVATRLTTPALPLLRYATGMLWQAAFGGFAFAYGPMPMRQKPETRA
jgi:uncharacterized protein involved in response to NO